MLNIQVILGRLLRVGFCRPSRISQRPLFRFSRVTAPAQFATPGHEIADLSARFARSNQPPCRPKIVSLRETLEQSEISEIRFSRFSGGATAGSIRRFGSGSVRENLGYGFRNRLIVFGFWNASTQIREEITEISFGYSSGVR